MKIYFVTGKGGVGKSAVAAAMAFRLAQAGYRTLLVEIGPQSFYQDYFESELKRNKSDKNDTSDKNASQAIGFKPLKFSPFSVVPPLATMQTFPKMSSLSWSASMDLCLWTPQDCLKDYALHLLKVENLYKLFFENPISKSLIQIAPGLNEISILGKITSSIREIGTPLEYDYLIIDSYATGHFLSMINAPKGLSKAIKVGPMGEQSLDIFHILQNPNLVKYFVVSLPEELPTEESLDLISEIRKSTGQSCTFLLNKVIPFAADNKKPVCDVDTNDSVPSFDGYLEKQYFKYQQSLKKISEKNIHSYILPYVFSINSAEITASLASHLTESLGLKDGISV